jgi:hypothetical protein
MSLGDPTVPTVSLEPLRDTAGPDMDEDAGSIHPMDEDEDEDGGETPRKTRSKKRVSVVSPTTDVDAPRTQRRRQSVSVCIYISHTASDVVTMFIDILWPVPSGGRTGMRTPTPRKGKEEYHCVPMMQNKEDALFP